MERSKLSIHYVVIIEDTVNMVFLWKQWYLTRFNLKTIFKPENKSICGTNDHFWCFKFWNFMEYCRGRNIRNLYCWLKLWVRVQINVLWFGKYDPFLVFTMQFFLPSQKIVIPKHNTKKERVFFLINAGWIVSGILYIFFNIIQGSQLYLKLLVIIFMLMILTRKNCCTQSTTRIYWSRSLSTSDIFHMLTK